LTTQEKEEIPPWTRIERQLAGEKVPFKYLANFLDESCFEKLRSFDPFKAILIFDLEMIPSINNQAKFEGFKTLIETNGYFYTRKTLNKNKNFHRDYRSFYHLNAS